MVDAWREYVADTDPTHAESFFEITELTIGSNVVLAFDASTSRVYSLEWRSLGGSSAWQQVQAETNETGSGPGHTLRDTNATSGPRAYRVEVAVP